MIKILIIHVLARVGSYLCRKAIVIAGNGSIDFEVFTNDHSASLVCNCFSQPRETFLKNAVLFVILSIFVGSSTRAGLSLYLIIMKNLS